MYIVFRHMINRMRLLVSFYFTTLYFSYKKGVFGDFFSQLLFRLFVAPFEFEFTKRVQITLLLNHHRQN